MLKQIRKKLKRKEVRKEEVHGEKYAKLLRAFKKAWAERESLIKKNHQLEEELLQIEGVFIDELLKKDAELRELITQLEATKQEQSI